MNRLVLPPRYSANDAARIFWRARGCNLFGLWRPRPVKASADGLPTSLELVWMPVYAFRMTLTRGPRQSSLWVSVDASFGGFALFERLDVLEELEPEGEVFEPVLEISDAEQRGREGLIRYFLRKRGAKPSAARVEGHCFYHTPVWVYYFRRFGQKIDLAVLDGYTGDRLGGRMRIAVLEAFIRRREERRSGGEV